MKKISVFLTVMMVFMIGSAPMSAKTKEVVLDASQVSSAADIESAIYTATKNGAQPGIVTLDSSKGDFVYAGPDRTIDIRFSNVTLRSKNGAVIRNCENGVFLDSTPINWITIKGITFHCELSGVLAWAGEHVVIQDNTFHVRAYGVYFIDGKDWTITGNRAEALESGVYVYYSSNVEVRANHLTGGSGVVLNQSTKAKVAKNEIYAIWHGILLGPDASYNDISTNKVLSTQYAGITFKGGNEYNKVLANYVRCASGYTCELYETDILPLSATNKFAGNKFFSDEKPHTFDATLMPGVWSIFKLGASSDGVAYIADVTPLHDSVAGAYISFMIKPEYDGQQWNDVLRVMIPAGFPKQQVQITVFEMSGLQSILDVTDALPPGEWRGYAIAHPMAYFPTAYLVDLDPLEASVEGATFERYLIHPEFPWGDWLDTLRVQTEKWLPSDPLNTRMRIYTADHLYIVSDFNVTLTKNDTWTEFVVDSSSFKRGYVVRAFPLNGDTQAELDYYTIQPEFNGQQWNDVLRIRMGNLNADWESIEYNFKVYACDNTVCP
jgi:hypothetical protein